MSQEFTAAVSVTERGTVIEMTGTVNRAAQPGLEAAYKKAVTHPGEIVLDFHRVDYINSTGIAVLVGILAAARSADREIGALGLSEHYQEVFEITRLSDFMNIYQETTSGE